MLRITHTIISQNIADTSWITLYVRQNAAKYSLFNWQIHLSIYDRAGYLLSAMYHKINSPTGQFHSNYRSYSPFSVWEVQMKRVTPVHAKPITISVRYCSMQLTRYPIAGNKFLPSMTCPDKYFLSSSCRQITTDLSPDFDFPCTKHEYKALGLTHHYTEP